MTEYDRGAYTPQPDAPLQFDARGPRGRKPMPMTLIGSGAVLIVLLGALAMHYRQDHKPASDPARPVGEPIAQVKTAAPAAAQPKDASGAVDVFGGAKTAAATPNFAAAPEAPKPRAQLTIQAAEPATLKSAPLATTNAATPPPLVTAKAAPTAAAKSASAATPVAVAKAAPALVTTPAHPATTYTAPTLASVAKPSATDVVAKLAATPVAKPAPTTAIATAKPAVAKAATAAKPDATALAKAGTTAPAAKSVTGGAAVVQIGAFSSTAQSEKGWADVSAAMAGAMGGKSKRVEMLDKDGKTLYRTSVAGFSSRAAADAFCRALAAKGHICFAKG
jgi:hypothetical protein